MVMLSHAAALAASGGAGARVSGHVGADGSAEENIALSKAVWQKLAQNGGKVPESLKH